MNERQKQDVHNVPPIFAKGARVVRGPQWKNRFTDQDGGVGGLGTIIDTPSNCEYDLAVVWDARSPSWSSRNPSGKYFYRASEIYVVDLATAGVVHEFNCSECQEKPIKGILWVCDVCINTYLCSTCYHGDKHYLAHKFRRVCVSDDRYGKRMNPRKDSMRRKVTLKGLFPGAKIVRGFHWDWASADGGSGNTGEVLGIYDWNHSAEGNVSYGGGVAVLWNGQKEMQMLRVGGEGKVDVLAVEVQEGPPIYMDHLPVVQSTRPGYSTIGRIRRIISVGSQGPASSSEESSPINSSRNSSASSLNIASSPKIQRHSSTASTLPWTQAPTGKSNFALTTILPFRKSKEKFFNGEMVKIALPLGRFQMAQCNVGGGQDPLQIHSEYKDEIGIVESLDTFDEDDWHLLIRYPDQNKYVLHHSTLEKIYPQNTGGSSKSSNYGSIVIDAPSEHTTPTPAPRKNSPLLVSAPKSDSGVFPNSDGSSSPPAVQENPSSEIISQNEGKDQHIRNLTERIEKAVIKGKIPDFSEFSETEIREALSSGKIWLPVIQTEFLEVFHVMLQEQADIQCKDEEGNTPLHYAVMLDKGFFFHRLLDAGADPSIENCECLSPFHVAVETGKVDFVDAMLRKDEALPNTPQTSTGMTALHMATKEGYANITRLLLDHGSEKDASTNSLDTPLSLAVVSNHPTIVRILVESGCNINMSTASGNTALHLAISKHSDSHIGKNKVCRCLEEGDYDSQEKAEAAKSYAWMALYLASSNANIGKQNRTGMGPLEYANSQVFKDAIRKAYTTGKMPPMKGVQPREECGHKKRSLPTTPRSPNGLPPLPPRGVLPIYRPGPPRKISHSPEEDDLDNERKYEAPSTSSADKQPYLLPRKFSNSPTDAFHTYYQPVTKERSLTTTPISPAEETDRQLDQRFLSTSSTDDGNPPLPSRELEDSPTDTFPFYRRVSIRDSVNHRPVSIDSEHIYAEIDEGMISPSGAATAPPVLPLACPPGNDSPRSGSLSEREFDEKARESEDEEVQFTSGETKKPQKGVLLNESKAVQELKGKANQLMLKQIKPIKKEVAKCEKCTENPMNTIILYCGHRLCNSCDADKLNSCFVCDGFVSRRMEI